MHLAITSGGTRVAIDDVRVITNISRGGTGAHIAEYAVETGHSVTYVGNETTSLPYVGNLSAKAWNKGFDGATIERIAKFEKARIEGRLSLETASFFQDYVEAVLRAAKNPARDAIVLSAAVSDFGPVSSGHGKLDSKTGLTLELEPLTKVRDLIRGVSDRVAIVAFKQMTKDCHRGELLNRAFESMAKGDHDLVVANLTDSVNGAFVPLETWIVRADGHLAMLEDRNRLPQVLVDEEIPYAVEYRRSKSSYPS